MVRVDKPGQAKSAVEDEIDRVVARVLDNEQGEVLMTYLKNQTLNRVLGPHATADELRHLEGQRWLVAMLVQRLNNFRKRT